MQQNGFYQVKHTLIFARDLFGDFHDHIKIAKINTHKHNSGT